MPPPGRAPKGRVTLASAAAGAGVPPGTVEGEPAGDPGPAFFPSVVPNRAACTTACLAPEDATSASLGTVDSFAPVTRPGSLKAATAAPANATETTMIVRVLLTLSPAVADAL
jgi:hypothetical protein